MLAEAHNIACPADEISAYIDGELAGARELELEAHFAACSQCTAELNFQKQFIGSLDNSLKHEGDIAIPEDFARHIVANAESTVAGLRRPRELYNAFFICAGLLLFGLFALGADADKLLGGVGAALEQAGAVGGFFARVVYSIFLGFAIIIRAIAAQVEIGGSYLFIAAALLGFVVLTYASRKVLRIVRA